MLLSSAALFAALATAGEPIERFQAPRQLGERVRTVIRYEEEWEKFWKDSQDKNSGCPRQTPQPPIPKVDFKGKMAVIASTGRRPTAGTTIAITEANQTAAGYEFLVVESRAPKGALVPQMITCPTAVVFVPDMTGTVLFKEKSFTWSKVEHPEPALISGKGAAKHRRALLEHPEFKKIAEAANAKVLGASASQSRDTVYVTGKLLIPSPTGACRLRVMSSRKKDANLEISQLEQLRRLPEVMKEFNTMSERFLPGLHAQAGTKEIGCDLWPQGDRVKIDLFWPAFKDEDEFKFPKGAKFYRLKSTNADPRVVPQDASDVEGDW